MFALKGGLRFVLVTVGIIVLTSIGIDASQYLSGAPSALGILADHVTEGTCPTGMVFIEAGTEDFCIDAYEASPAADCPVKDTVTTNDTTNNLLVASCEPQSVADTVPWRFVSLYEAQKLCARANKRLPNNAEWHRAGLTLEVTDGCVIDSNRVQPSGNTTCVTNDGVHDLVGNVWEWVDETVEDGVMSQRTLPSTGYVAVVDTNGLVVETTDAPVSTMGDDYAWTDVEGSYGMVRGGFYANGSDAGVFAQNLNVDFDLRTNGIGFRCVSDV